ncbi:tRNA1(Val) (adenine(37)-N6)-methyltransferase [Mucilaginibacter litoreus]|uniref:tRNA1(Val) (adenine(37)-N6)-methyltransferase n=1 Tax=Mucilaginibacter litoreus TaxID=1048221 RepID=A0ABW3AU76_9SPHI
MGVFRFKKFAVDQTGCAMKVNTDGVLLGALASAEDPQQILDIGTGTGVIALMLAQRFPNAKVDAVEIDASAAETAKKNFVTSIFNDRVCVYANSFESFLYDHPGRHYDLIISNPPFFLNSLASASENKSLARHTDMAFFERLIESVSIHLSDTGKCQLILPLPVAEMVKSLLNNYDLMLQNVISIKSFENSVPHREIITFGGSTVKFEDSNVVIYRKPKVYSDQYATLLKEFLTIF